MHSCRIGEWTSCRAEQSASEQCVALQDGSYAQDRRTPPLADMAKPEAKLAQMVKEESKAAAEANGAMPHPKSEPQQAGAQVLPCLQALTSASLGLR